MTTLVLLTQKFPFESGEEFLATELSVLEQSFDRVIVIPTGVRNFSSPRPVGNATQVRIVKNPRTKKDIAFTFFSSFFPAVRLVISELIKTSWNFKLLKYYLYHIPFALHLKSVISKELVCSEEFVLYSYWMDTNAFAASVLRRTHPEIKLVVRSHGGDLYNERQKSGEVAFRKTVYSASQSLIFISEHGLNYAATHYPEYASKMQVFKLGVEDFGLNPSSNIPLSFQVVTCSSIIPLKRLSLIAKVLNNSKVPINWTHFGGDNSAITRLKKSFPKLRNDLVINWRGKVGNREITNFYDNEFVDVLVNLSSSEGIPVSMMEAISFGIPVFSNAVGGIPEIVSSKTGKLVPEGLNLERLVLEFDGFLLSGKSRDFKFRIGVKQFWSENYFAKSNYARYATHLKNQSFKRPISK